MENSQASNPPELLKNPWRDILQWDEKNLKELREKIAEFIPEKDLNCVNILLIGPPGTGKTSFYNSCITALSDERRVKDPFTVRSGGDCVTVRLQRTNLYVDRNKYVKVNLYDCKGFSEVNAIDEEDVKKLIDGHIKEGYKFQKNKTISEKDEFYNANPGLADRMHCIVYVVKSVNPNGLLFDKICEKIFNTVGRDYGEQNIHQIVLMSRIDLVRASIRKNPCHIFQSEEVEEKLENFKEMFQLNKNRFLPTMNYTEEMYPRTEIDYMTLYNLLQMMNGANDYLKYIVQNQRQT